MDELENIPTYDEINNNNNDDDNLVYLSPEWFRKKALNYKEIEEEANKLYEQFQSAYSMEKLKALSGKEVLNTIFSNGNNLTYLFHALEQDTQYRRFGRMSLGNAINAGLYFSKEANSWKTKMGIGGERLVSEEEAISIGTEIRDVLVKGAEIIKEFEEPTTPNDYEGLFERLNNAIPEYVSKIWVLKYYHMIFPTIFPTFYNEEWQRYILYNLNIMPSDSQFIRMGQINCFVKSCGISNVMFFHIMYQTIGELKTFYRIGTGQNGEWFDDWKNNNYVAIGWNELGDLYQKFHNTKNKNKKELLKDELKDKLAELYNFDSSMSSKKYKEINNFYSAPAETTYVVAMNGQKVLGIGTFASDYYYKENNEENGAHCRKINWLKVFEDPKILPIVDEGRLTTFYPLTKDKNMLYLYSLLNDKEVKMNNEILQTTKSVSAERLKKGYTGYESEFSRNRIIFGAPGTGKSYTLNRECKELLGDENETNYERVTFHPDYSYANFVGTYKPVPCKDSDGKDAITYQYVPGPFMRIYVKALKNSRTDNIEPYLLIVEEINRAKVSAVFGDVFQLLDRDDDGVSEYPIEASEDIKKYLVEQLGGKISDYEKIYIPDNMFIWATMNSADQGVFPMDTAFKRRWDFTYIGINEKEEDIKNKYVVLGSGSDKRRVEWNELRKAINDKLASFNINEDKLIGPYFLSKKVIATNENNEINQNTFISTFKGKVLMYLFDDAAKQKRKSLFADDVDTSKYSAVCDAFDKKGVYVFCDDISNKFNEVIDER